MKTTTKKRSRFIARLARHRYEIATLAAMSTATACATHPSQSEESIGQAQSKVITSAQGIAASQKAIDFMIGDAVAFTQQNQCLSCHRQPDTLISASTAAQLLPGINLDTSTDTGTGFIANLVVNTQQVDGHWDNGGGQPQSMSAEALWAIAGYARAGGSVNVLPSVKRGLLWLAPLRSITTFPNDGQPFAGQQRTYINNDFVDSPQMFDWYLPTTQSVFATRVLLDLDPTLSASDVSTLSAQQVSFTDALEGTTMRALGTSTVQQLALTGIAMSESGRASTADGQAIGQALLARQTSGSGWGDPSSPDSSLWGVNTLTTGEALYALCRLGIRARANAAAGQGLDWLASQQQDDGSWVVYPHNSSVSSSWALLAMACASNPRGTAEFNPLTADGAPSAPVSESFTTTLTVTNTSSDPRVAGVTVAGAPEGSIISIQPSSLPLDGDASGSITVTVTLPPGLPPSTSYPLVATAAFADTDGNPQSQVAATYTLAVGSQPDATLSGTTVAFDALPAHADIGSTLSLSSQVKGSDGNPIHSGSVVYSVDGTQIGTASLAGDSFVSSWSIPQLAMGTHTIHAAYSGSDGSIVFDPSSADQQIDIEPPPPAAPEVAGVADGSSSTSGQYSLSGHGTPGDTIAILANGDVVRTATIGADGSWSAAFALGPGAYAISTIETGPGGSSEPSTANVSVQPTAPSVGGPYPGTTFTSMTTEVSGTATPGATINVLRNGVVIATTTAGEDGSYSVGVDLVAGPNALSVSQTVNGQSSALSGVVYNEAPAAPSITSPAPSASSQQKGQTTIRGAAVPGATVVLVDNGTVIASAVAGEDGSYAFPVTLPPGQNELSVTSSVGGVPGAPSRSVSIRIDSDAPFFPVYPVDLFAYASSSDGAPVSWPAIYAFDAQDGRLSTMCDHVSGEKFPLGTTRVICTASDSLGNPAFANFDVKVQLQSLPTLVLPAGNKVVVKSSIPDGANVSFDVTAVGADQKPLAALCAPASGSFFKMGTTKVTCTANDSVAATESSATFDVVVVPGSYVAVSAAPSSQSSGCSISHGESSKDVGGLLGLALAAVIVRRRKKQVEG